MAEDNQMKKMLRKSPRNLKTSNFEGSGYLTKKEKDKMMKSQPLRKKKKDLKPCSTTLLEICTIGSQNLEVESDSLFVSKPIPDDETRDKLPGAHDDDQVALDCVEGSTSCSYNQMRAHFIEHNKAKSHPLERAERFQVNLNPQFPTFIKSMIRSQVTCGFWLGLPRSFCHAHLPNKDIMMCLVDENQEKYPVKFLACRAGFSGGWKGFSISHKLVEGDSLIFQLVEPTQFQVYVTRACSVAEIDGCGLLEQTDSLNNVAGKRTKKSEITSETFLPNQLSAVLPQPTADSRSENYEAGLEVLMDTKFSETISDFEDNTNIESFTIVVNGAVIDSHLSEEERSKYYELCCSQKSCLHGKLLDGIDSQLAAGIISQTITIADAIRATKLSTAEEEFVAWGKKLSEFELQGMNVGFLQARVKTLASLLVEPGDVMNSESYQKVVAQKDDVMEKVETLKSKIIELKENCKQFDTEIEILEMEVDRYELKFQEIVDASW